MDDLKSHLCLCKETSHSWGQTSLPEKSPGRLGEVTGVEFVKIIENLVEMFKVCIHTNMSVM